MFIGHYGVAFAAISVAPRVPLGIYFIAVQLPRRIVLDICFRRDRKVADRAGFTQYNSYVLYFMPYTHGLVAALGWSFVSGAAWGIVRRNKREGAVIAAAVFSHFILDVPMHTPDMPLLSNNSYKLGLGLWNHWQWALALELATLLGGWALWMWIRGAANPPRLVEKLFLASLVLFALATPFMPPPSSSFAFAVQALTFYLVLAALAQATDKSRTKTTS